MRQVVKPANVLKHIPLLSRVLARRAVLVVDDQGAPQSSSLGQLALERCPLVRPTPAEGRLVPKPQKVVGAAAAAAAG